jgi:hypothetical protein
MECRHLTPQENKALFSWTEESEILFTERVDEFSDVHQTFPFLPQPILSGPLKLFTGPTIYYLILLIRVAQHFRGCVGNYKNPKGAILIDQQGQLAMFR